ncbi:magnesium transporter [Ectothiorhodosinus mongolicus]|uniref:Magnesium transporter MgtE n=1 Tax=Ectothiorhodosinus mongolicus TaxID=233100 RepID=A0A1R3VPW2_9GAMM|nr:magnesium transporter [Ectothiorhodosinus mongolicus]ULX56658.1 magnesium transporter [Ectothiorhodosinus mongolicus]SIT66690.1 magnesium transporter [Ectothiorhodosinus mongolicus]
MSESLSVEQLSKHLEAGDWQILHAHLDVLQDQDLAELVAELDRRHWVVLFRTLPQERAADVFSYFSEDQQQGIMLDLNDDERAALLAELSFDDAAAVIHRLPEELARDLMSLLPDKDRWVIKSLLAYPVDSAGRRMTPEFIALRSEWTLAQALDHVREKYEESETVNVAFVTDEDGRLLGVVKLKDLLLGAAKRQVGSLMRTDVIHVQTRADQEEAVQLIRRYDLEVLPVVDEREILVGIITVDDVMDVTEEETTEDFLRMGSVGVGPLMLNLKDAGMQLLYRKRVGWLLILILVNLVSGAAIALFETAIEMVVALVFFLPLVIASGGNAGTQASTLMVRSLATGDVQLRDWWSLWAKELLVSVALGFTLGLAIWGAAAWLGGPDVGLAVAIAMVLVVIVGSMVGLLLPLILTRLKMDPATASAPLVTSIADVGGILVYFGVATAILQLQV